MQVLPIQALCVLKDTVVAYKNGSLYTYRFESNRYFKKKHFLCKIPMSNKMRILASLPVLRRIFRTMPRAALSLSDHCFIFAFLGRIYRVDAYTGEIVVEHAFRKPMRAPLTFTPIQNVPGFSDTVLYGEYHGNVHNGEMCVYSRSANGKWSPRYTFAANTICHIHGLVADPNNKRVLILTGDTDQQSAIYSATNNFTRVERLLGGTQQSRACVAFPHNGGVLYATDTPLASNALYCFCDGNLKRIADMCAPTIFGAKSSEGSYWFATSVEPDSRLPSWRYLFTRKLGAGVSDRYVRIVAGTPDSGFQTVLKMKKDWLPMALCQFGNATILPYQRGVLIVPQSVCRYSGKTIYIERTTN